MNEEDILNTVKEDDILNTVIFGPDRVNCEIHGLTSYISINIDDESIGMYCLKCLNELLTKNIKNYAVVKK